MHQPTSHNRPSPLARATQAVALGVGLAGTLPAAAQDLQSKGDAPARLQATPNEGPAQKLTLPPIPKEVTAVAKEAKPAIQDSLQPLPNPESSSFWNKLFSGMSAAFSGGTMAWYYMQIRRKETAISVPSITLQSTNDILLCVAAAVNHQGWGAFSTAALFGLGGIVCLRAALKVTKEAAKREGAEPQTHFRGRDYICAAGCLIGWGALIASWTPKVSALFPNDALAIAGSWIATATYILASIPIMIDMLAAPKPEEIRTVAGRRGLEIAKIAGPYVGGTIAHCLAFGAIPEYTWATVPQTAGLLVNNLFLTTFLMIWGARRVKANDDVRT